MKRRSHPSHPRPAELTGLADGSLPAAERARVQRAVDASAELRASVEAQRRVLAAIENARVGAPVALRMQLAAVPVRDRSVRWPRRAVGAVAAGVTAAAVAVAAWLAIAGGFAAGPPSVAQAALLGQRPPQAAAPAGRDGSTTLPQLQAAGLPYPYWEDRFGYRATGVRRDSLGGRAATTVLYTDRGGQQVAYTIVSGSALPAGSRTDQTVLDGVVLRTLVTGGHVVVTWLRAGHTCVLTGVGTSLSVLERLAAWRDGGANAYARAGDGV